MGPNRSLGPTSSLCWWKIRWDRSRGLALRFAWVRGSAEKEQFPELEKARGSQQAGNIGQGNYPSLHQVDGFLTSFLTLGTTSGFLQLTGSSKTHLCPFSKWLSQANTAVLFASQLLCCTGNEGSTLDQPGTPVPSLWYIVRGLQGIRVVTRTRWACGLGLLTCSSTHTSKKVITQELD